MLQSNLDRPDVALSKFEAAPSADESGIGPLLFNLQGFLRRRYGTVLLAALLALGVGLVYLRLTPPVYTAHVQILLTNPKAQFVQQESVVAETPGATGVG